MIKLLKCLHHLLLEWRILNRKRSLFGNELRREIGLGPDQANLFKEVKPSVTVIVVMHNNKAIIGQCLRACIKFNNYNYEIILVDNHSSDGGYEWVETQYDKRIKLIRNNVNGAASGRNLGAAAAKTEYLMFLDSDQGPIKPGWMDVFLHILDQHPEIGAVGWRGGFLTESDLTGPNLAHLPPLSGLLRTNIDYLESGGLMMRKSLFEQIGGFDTKYDPHAFEDADLSRKIVAAGYQIAYCPRLEIYHLPHSTTKANEGGQEYLTQFGRNASYFRDKWLK